jgi:serine/threonine protein kinase
VSENHHDDDKTQTHIPLMKDTTVGHYRIVGKIGAGGMGEVYLAEDTKLDRKVALKFLPHHLCRDEDCRQRFTREAQAAAKLDHPNIVTVHEVDEYKGRPYFAMAHVEGQSLKEYSSGQELSIEKILELGIQICEGLQAAHDNGITHRDIKPSNILIDSHGRARIVDFGLASVMGKDQLTKTGSTLGTTGYMSPEQVRGQEIDHRSDLFSLGVVLYELITKQNPFKRDSEAATLKAVSDDTPHPVARFRSNVPEGIEGIIDKALDKNRDTRYQHADGFGADLLRIRQELSGQITQAAPPRKRIGVFTYLLIVIGVVAVSIIAGIQLFKDNERRAVVPEFKKITYTGDAYYSAISPDGTYYAYSRVSTEPKGDLVTVYMSDFEGGQAIPVFQGDYVQSICWSPDGKELLLRAKKIGDTTLPSVYLVPRLGGKVRKYDIPGSPSDYWDIAWLPDGTKFVSIADDNRLIYTDKKTGDTSVVPFTREFQYTLIGNFCPSGRWLSFYGMSGTEAGLWLIGSDGTDVHKIGDGLLGYQTWSPSGDAVYAMETSFAPNGNRIWRFNVDSQSGKLQGEPEVLLSGLPSAIGISVSDDGKKLLCRQFSYITNLKRVFFDPKEDPASLHTEQLTTGTGLIIAPSISPDGASISYSAESGGEYHVFIRALDGGDAVQLTRSGVFNCPSRWSPDGEYIAVTGIISLDDLQNAYLAIINRDGTSSRVLTNVSEAVPSFWFDWPISNRLIINYDGRNSLLFANPETGDTTTWQYDTTKGRIDYPRMSPDGKMIAASRERGGVDVTDIWLLSIADGTETLLTEVDAYIMDWSRDGKWIYFFTQDWLIARINIESKEIDTLAILTGMDWNIGENSIALSPDEKWAVYVVGLVQRDLYLIENFDPNVK